MMKKACTATRPGMMLISHAPACDIKTAKARNRRIDPIDLTHHQRTIARASKQAHTVFKETLRIVFFVFILFVFIILLDWFVALYTDDHVSTRSFPYVSCSLHFLIDKS